MRTPSFLRKDPETGKLMISLRARLILAVTAEMVVSILVSFGIAEVWHWIFGENLKDYSPEDIAEARYVNKNGEIIGEWIDWKVPNSDVVEKRILTVSYNAKDWVRIKIRDKVFKVRKSD